MGLPAFPLVEAQVREPLLPLSLFRNRVFSVANGAGLIVGFALLGTVFFMTQYFQEVQGFTALESGLRTLPTTMGIFLVAPFAALLAAALLVAFLLGQQQRAPSASDEPPDSPEMTITSAMQPIAATGDRYQKGEPL